MAIAFDNSVDGANNGGTTNNLSFSLTVNTGPAYVLVAFLGDSITGADDITSVTLSTVGMSLIQKSTGGTASNRFTYTYAIANIAAGAHTIAINCTANHYLIALAASWSGNPGNDTSTAATAGTVSPYTTSLTTISDQSWVLLADGGAGVAASTGSTSRVIGAAFNEPGIFDSNAAISPPAAYSMSTTTTNIVTVDDIHIMLSIAPPAAGGVISYQPIAMQIGISLCM